MATLTEDVSALIAQGYETLDPWALSQLCAGSAAAAAIRRAGGDDLQLTPDGMQLRATNIAMSDALRGYVASRKDAAIAYLRTEAAQGAFFDQALAGEVAGLYLREQLEAPAFNLQGKLEVPCVQGLAGSGKTYMLASISRMAIELGMGVLVVAPTNAAVKVLRKALADQGLGSDQGVTCSTAHSALRVQCLRACALPVISALQAIAPKASEPGANMRPGDLEVQGLSAGDDEYIAARLSRGKPAALKRALRNLDACFDDKGNARPFQVLRTLQMLGFPALDERLHYWGEQPVGTGTLVLMDEASMLPLGMARTVLQSGGKVVAFGDPYQLPPVGQLTYTGKDGIERPDVPLLDHVSATWTVHLQRSRRTGDGSVIPALAAQCFSRPSTMLMGRALGEAAQSAPAQVRAFASLEQVPRQDLIEGVVVSFTNRARLAANRKVRELLGHRTDRLQENDWLAVDTPDEGKEFTKSERVRVVGLVTDGETGEPLAVVERTGEDGELEQVTTGLRFRDDSLAREGEAAGLFMKGLGFEFAGADFWGNEVPGMTFGFAITSHKAQGGGWPSVTILVDDILSNGARHDDRSPLPDGRIVKTWCRLLYVALTRTRGHLNLVSSSIARG